ncbi:MAG: hypothetical protein WA364_18565 [Candidatus Nitrosopolaris sp.]
MTKALVGMVGMAEHKLIQGMEGTVHQVSERVIAVWMAPQDALVTPVLKSDGVLFLFYPLILSSVI